MIRVAIPVFRMRVSPVFDACTRILVVDVETAREIDRKEIYLDALSLTERVTILRKFGVHTVICSGISDRLANMLSGTRITLVSNISGEVEQVLAAYLAKSLDDPRFRMPGTRVTSHPGNIQAGTPGRSETVEPAVKGGDRHEIR